MDNFSRIMLVGLLLIVGAMILRPLADCVVKRRVVREVRGCTAGECWVRYSDGGWGLEKGAYLGKLVEHCELAD